MNHHPTTINHSFNTGYTRNSIQKHHPPPPWIGAQWQVVGFFQSPQAPNLQSFPSFCRGTKISGTQTGCRIPKTKKRTIAYNPYNERAFGTKYQKKTSAWMKPPVRIPIISHRIAPPSWIFYYRLFRANWHNIGTCIVWFLILPIWVVWPRWTEHWSVRYIDWTFQWFPLQKDFHGISTVSTGNHGTCPSWKSVCVRSCTWYFILCCMSSTYYSYCKNR